MKQVEYEIINPIPNTDYSPGQILTAREVPRERETIIVGGLWLGQGAGNRTYKTVLFEELVEKKYVKRYIKPIKKPNTEAGKSGEAEQEGIKELFS